MRWFNNQTMTFKLVLSFVVVAAMAGYLGISGWRTMRSMVASQTDLYVNTLIPLTELGKGNAALKGMHEDVLKFIAESDPAAIAKVQKAIEDDEHDMRAAIDKFASIALSDRDKVNLAKLEEAWKKYKGIRDRVLVLAREKKDAEALRLNLGDGEDAGGAVENAFADLIALNLDDAKQINIAFESEASGTETLMLAMTVIAFAAAVGFGLVIARLISVPLKELARQAELVASAALFVWSL